MKTLEQKYNEKLSELNQEFDIKKKLFDLCGIEPNVITGKNPFASFHCEKLEDFIKVLQTVKTSGKNYVLTFAGSADMQTFSPYTVHLSTPTSQPKFVDISVKFDGEICPVWVELPASLHPCFEIRNVQGEHKGFSRYETEYRARCTAKISVMQYSGKHDVLYANENEAETMQEIIFGTVNA